MRASRYEDNREGILKEIQKAQDRHGQPPTIRDLAATFEVGVATMHAHLQKLSDEGMIEWRKGKHRSLKCTPAGSLVAS